MTELVDTEERRDIGDALPKGMERRLALRLLTYWREICGDRDFPTFADIDPSAMDDMWPNCFVLDVDGFEEDPIFRIIGETIGQQDDLDLIDQPISVVPQNTLLHAGTSYFGLVVLKRAPVSRGGEYMTRAGARILYRSALLPISDDGMTISGILGAANCRIFGDDR